MAKSDKRPPQPRAQRWWRRLLVVFLVLIAGWLVVHAKLSRDQRQGVAAVKTLGGSAYYTYQLGESGYNEAAEPPLTPWLWKTVGIDFFSRVVVVDLHGRQFADHDLACLKNLPKLGGLNLGNTSLSDAGMPYLAHLTELDVLVLAGTQISDKSSKTIEKFSRLRILDLSGSRITDKTLVHVAALPGLEYLRLDNTEVSDEGLSQLSGLDGLNVLDLRHTSVSPAGVKKMRGALPRCNVMH